MKFVCRCLSVLYLFSFYTVYCGITLNADRHLELETNQNISNSDEKALDRSGRYLLHEAAKKGNLSAIKYLVTDQRGDVNEQDGYGITALCVAAEAGQLESVKLLLDLGADKNISSPYGLWTLMHIAAKGGNVEVLRILLRYNNVDVRTSDNETPAFSAAKKGNVEALRFLLENGADPYATDVLRNNLLHEAVYLNQLNTVRELIRYKELINATNKLDRLPIDVGIFTPNIDIVKELVKAGSYISDKTIWSYYNYNRFDIMKYLVVKSGKINLRITYDRRDCRETLLMILLNKEVLRYDLIKFMLDQGSDVNINYCENITALHRAAYYEKINTQEIIKLLLDRGAVINAPDKDGFTPLDYAEGEGNKHVAEYLRKLGAVSGKKSPSISDNDSLITTTESDRVVNLQKDLEPNTDQVNKVGSNELTFLHVAGTNHDLEGVHQLITDHQLDNTDKDHKSIKILVNYNKDIKYKRSSNSDESADTDHIKLQQNVH